MDKEQIRNKIKWLRESENENVKFNVNKLGGVLVCILFWELLPAITIQELYEGIKGLKDEGLELRYSLEPLNTKEDESNFLNNIILNLPNNK